MAMPQINSSQLSPSSRYRRPLSSASRRSAHSPTHQRGVSSGGMSMRKSTEEKNKTMPVLSSDRAAVQEERCNMMVGKLKRQIDSEKKKLRSLRTAYTQEVAARTELQNFFKKCVEDARQDMARNKKTSKTSGRPLDIGSVPLEELTAEDRARLIENWLSQDQVIYTLYEKMFPAPGQNPSASARPGKDMRTSVPPHLDSLAEDSLDENEEDKNNQSDDDGADHYDYDNQKEEDQEEVQDMFRRPEKSGDAGNNSARNNAGRNENSERWPYESRSSR